MSNRIEALRLTAQFLYTLHYKQPESELGKMFKTYADLCIINVPNKYRFTRQEIANMKEASNNRPSRPAGRRGSR
ncbi:MAG: hypothetical protein AB1690_02520 [Candidatus Zixiibacteriota bacterium]